MLASYFILAAFAVSGVFTETPMEKPCTINHYGFGPLFSCGDPTNLVRTEKGMVRPYGKNGRCMVMSMVMNKELSQGVECGLKCQTNFIDCHNEKLTIHPVAHWVGDNPPAPFVSAVC